MNFAQQTYICDGCVHLFLNYPSDLTLSSQRFCMLCQKKKLLAKWNVFKKLRVVKFIACGLLGYKFKSAEAWFNKKKLPKALRTNRQISQVTETHSHSRLSRFMRIAFLVVLIKICFSLLLHDPYFFSLWEIMLSELFGENWTWRTYARGKSKPFSVCQFSYASWMKEKTGCIDM